MNNLATDLVVEILLNLPVKSLLRFKSVCKSWYALIDSNEFINMHLDEASTSFTMVSNNDSFISNVDIYSGLFVFGKSLSHDLELLAHCDGLIFESSHRQGNNVLCNSATRETILLPKSDFPS
ncbi:hypothetical protein PTKIN_Ptkin08bG0054900 [Pterospermum kingtungense]